MNVSCEKFVELYLKFVIPGMNCPAETLLSNIKRAEELYEQHQSESSGNHSEAMDVLAKTHDFRFQQLKSYGESVNRAFEKEEIERLRSIYNSFELLKRITKANTGYEGYNITKI